MSNSSSPTTERPFSGLNMPRGWYYRILALILVLVFSWKVLSSEAVIDVSKFEFSDLLTLVVSFFAVWLSVMLYHRGSEIANRFYDEMHQFTNHVSLVLGRIEGSHGESLRHIGERVDSIPFNISATRTDIDQLQKEKDAIAQEKTKLEIEKRDLINEFSEGQSQQKAQLEVFARALEERMIALNEKDKKMMELTQELMELQNKLEVAKSRFDFEHRQHQEPIDEFRLTLRRRILRYLPESFDQTHPSHRRKYIEEILKGKSFDGIRYALVELGYITRDNHLTDYGMNNISELLSGKIHQ